MPKPAAPPLPAKRSRSSSRSVAGTESKRTNNDKDGATSKKAQKHSMDSDDEGVDGGLPFKKKTKSDNRHRFESFSDKIKQVKVNVANRFVKNYTDSPEGGESFFVESLPLWRDLNLTPEFTRYLRESSRYTQSLQQILYHKQLIVDQLVSFLEVPNTPALEPLLNLVTLLARDLQEEFFPYFFRVMETVTKLLKPESDPKRIEWIFNTLTYLFKYLAVQVTKEANETFQLFTLLLKDRRPYIRQFAAEAFAFIVRKIPNDALQSFFGLVMDTVVEDPMDIYVDGVALLIFETVKQVGGHLHSRAVSFLTLIMKLISEYSETANDPLEAVLNELFSKIIVHVKGEHSGELWKMIFAILEGQLNVFKKEGSNHSEISIRYLRLTLEMLRICVQAKYGTHIQDRKELHAKMGEALAVIFASENVPHAIVFPALESFASLICTSSLDELLVNSKKALDVLFAHKDPDIVFAFCESVRNRKCVNYSRVILPRFLSLLRQSWSDIPEKAIICLAILLSADGDQYVNDLPSEWRTNGGFLKLQGQQSGVSPFATFILQRATVQNPAMAEDSFASAVAVLTVARWIDVPTTEFLSLFAALLQSILELPRDSISATGRNSLLLSLALDCYVDRCLKARSISKLTTILPVVLTGLQSFLKNSLFGLMAISRFFEVYSALSQKVKLSQEDFQAIHDSVSPNLSLLNGQMRLYSAKLISCSGKLVGDEKVVAKCELYDVVVQLESLADSHETQRDKTVLVKRIEHSVVNRLFADTEQNAAMSYCLALLGSTFTPLRADSAKTLAAMAEKFPDQFWVSFYSAALHVRSKDFEANPDCSKNVVFAVEKPRKLAAHYDLFQTSNAGLDCVLSQIPNPEVTMLGRAQYYLQLLKTLRPLAHVVEKHSSEFLPWFLELFHGINGDQASNFDHKLVCSTQPVIIEFLEILSRLKNPAKLYRANDIFDLTLHLLTNGKQDIQKLALSALITWKQPGVLALEEQLRGMTEDRKFRSYLTRLNVSELKSTIPSTHIPDLMNALVRILYGKIVSPQGKRSATGMVARRNAIFSFMVSLDELERLAVFDLMVQPFVGISLDRDEQEQLSLLRKVSVRKQVGFLSVLEPMIKQLKNHMAPLLPKLLPVLLLIAKNGELVAAAMHLSEENEIEEAEEGDEDGDEDGDEEGNDEEQEADKELEDKVDDEQEEDELNEEEKVNGHKAWSIRPKYLRFIRKQSVRRLTELFEGCQEFDYGPYIEPIFASFLRGRLPKLDTENTQNPSSLLLLISSWTKHASFCQYLLHDEILLPKVFNILSAPVVKETVISQILEMVESILELDESNESMELASTVLGPSVRTFINNVESYLGKKMAEKSLYSKSRGGSLSDRTIRVLSSISKLVRQGSSETFEKLGGILLPFLRKSFKQVSENLKSNILQILIDLVPSLAQLSKSPLQSPYFAVVCTMFNAARDITCRLKAVEFLELLSQIDSRLAGIIDLLRDLNAMSRSRVGEPDFDRRFNALSRIQAIGATLDAQQWLPLLYSLMHLLHDEGEYSIRTSSFHTLATFLDRASGFDKESKTFVHPAEAALTQQVFAVVLPAIRQAMRHKSELVRQEFINLLGILVHRFPTHPEVSDLVFLLSDGDEEASFFNTIYHIQLHRRSRALRRLADACKLKKFSTSNITRIFLPLATHFVFESDRNVDTVLINDAIEAIAACASLLQWGRYIDLIRHFFKIISRRQQNEKELIRVIVAIVDKFNFPLAVGPEAVDGENSKEDKEEEEEDTETAAPGDAMEVDDEAVPEVGDGDTTKGTAAALEGRALAERIHSTVVKYLLPTLFTHLTFIEDDTRSVRAPVAFGIARLLKKLPEVSMQLMLPKLLTTMCVNLRSRYFEVRDSIRQALLRIVIELGPSYFLYVVKELESALKRGYQLHVLGYTIHMLLVGVADKFPPESLDECAAPMVRIFINDIFGDTGEERTVDALKNKMAEMRSTKSFNSFELLSKSIRAEKASVLLLPLKEIMLETSNSGTIHKLKEVLRHISIGLASNPKLDIQQILVFIHGLLSENLPLSQVKVSKKASEVDDRHRVKLSRKDELQDTLVYFSANAHLFIEFGLSLLSTLIKRGTVKPGVPAHLTMIDPLVTLLGKSLYSPHTSVFNAATRALVLLTTWPLPSLETGMPAIIFKLFEVITRHASKTTVEVVQSAFRLVAGIIRDCSYANLSAQQLSTVIEMLTPDLEEPGSHMTTFALIRAILSRKHISKEVYDLMDIILRLTVTSQSSRMQELCRAAFMQFLTEYPQGPLKVQKHLTYIIKNLQSYVYESGRNSMIYFIELFVSKFSESNLAEYSELLFCALVMSLVNDESAKCREHSAKVIIRLLKRFEQEKLDATFVLLTQWIVDRTNPSMPRAAIQVFGLFIEALGVSKTKEFIPPMLVNIEKALAATIAEMERIEAASQVDLDEEERDIVIPDVKNTRWEIGYYAMKTFAKLQAASNLEATVGSTQARIWTSVKTLLRHPHLWIKQQAARMLGNLFATVDPTRPIQKAKSQPSADTEPTAASVLLDSAESVFQLADATRRQLLCDVLNEDLAKQVVKNMVFLGRCMLVVRGNVKEDAEEGAIEAVIAAEHGATSLHRSPRTLLLRVYRKMVYMARGDISSPRRPLLRRSVFQWLGAMTHFIDKSELKPYLLLSLSVLHRTAEDVTTKGEGIDDLRNFAKEVMEVLSKYAGPEIYLEAYNEISRGIQQVRDERRVKRKLLVVENPEAAAKMKARRAELKKSSRKRKGDEIAKRKALFRTSIKSREFVREGQKALELP